MNKIAALTGLPDCMTYMDYLYKMATMYKNSKIITREQWDILCDVKGNLNLTYDSNTQCGIDNLLSGVSIFNAKKRFFKVLDSSSLNGRDFTGMELEWLHDNPSLDCVVLRQPLFDNKGASCVGTLTIGTDKVVEVKK